MPLLRRYTSFPSPNKFSKLSPTTFTSLPSLPTLLRACKTSLQLHQVHAHIIRKGLEQDHFLITLFIYLSNSFSTLSYSTAVFNRVLVPSTFLWNSLIRGYCQKSGFRNTVSVFIRMKREEGLPDRYTYPALLKACSSACEVSLGRAIHGLAVKSGDEGNIFVSTSLIDFYGKCREILCARKVFCEMSDRNVVSWTAMVVGYVNVGDLAEAKRLFDTMPQKNVASWNAIIGGFMKIGDLSSARKIFDEMPNKDVVSFTTMIDGYAKAGDMASARFLFEQAPVKDIVAWSALISGYAQNGLPNEAVRVFLEMDSRDVKPDKFVMVSLMSACSQVGNLELAKWVDSYVRRCGIDIHGVHVVAALIDMNAKCGNMESAEKLFDEMPRRDLISYCSLIQGLSIHGHGKQAVGLFNRMLEEGLVPDEVAFTIILTACSHAGLVEEGWHYFESMKNDYSIVPSPDHYACMVDLLSRSGRLKDAFELIKLMPMEPHAGAWGALLGACKLHCDIELGVVIAAHLLELEPHNACNYVLLSDIYAASDRWLDVSLVREKMKERGVRKIPGCSWVSFKG